MLKKIKSKYNPSTLSGALDIVVVEHPDGTLKSSPWHLRFGKLGLLHHTEKVITVAINGTPAPFLMYVDGKGRGQFFATQKISVPIREPNQQVEFPSFPAASMSMRPKDVRSLLSNKKTPPPPYIKLNTQYIIRDSTVDLTAALEFEEPDPQPSSTVASSIDLAQSVKTTGVDLMIDPNAGIPVPSPVLLQNIRHLLHSNQNTVQFTVSSLIQGPKTITALLYFWSSDLKLVISDVDGTVTSSDLLGHLLPSLGRDWTHPGLAELYSKIDEQGYKFVYLSSRPIGEAPMTRKMIQKIQQAGIPMPDGPLITCPDVLLHAMQRELRKKPHEFKIPTLNNIAALFSPRPNPFVFGFGNRQTDVVSYRACGLDDSKIILFDPSHKVKDHKGDLLFDSIKNLTPHIMQILNGEYEIIKKDEK